MGSGLLLLASKSKGVMRMRHAISVGMGFGKTSFDDAVIKAEEGDVVVIDPGEYKSVDGVQCGTLEIHGAGQSPTDVVILHRI